MKKLRITVDGKVFDVSVEVLEQTLQTAAPMSPATAAPVSVAAPVNALTPPPPPPAAASTAAGVIPSPLAGKVVSVEVQAGQAVKEGQQVLTLEAMKMNTFVYAPKAGIVAKVHVVAGDAVEEGAPLLTLS